VTQLRVSSLLRLIVLCQLRLFPTDVWSSGAIALCKLVVVLLLLPVWHPHCIELDAWPSRLHFHRCRIYNHVLLMVSVAVLQCFAVGYLWLLCTVVLSVLVNIAVVTLTGGLQLLVNSLINQRQLSFDFWIQPSATPSAAY
jgi:hypothetical protein